MEKEKRANYRVSTPSIWSVAGPRFFRFLKRIEDRNLPKTLAVLGCSDGNYVLPAAKRGFDVLAIDIDSAALYGGTITLYGEEYEVMGLTNRLRAEGLARRVTVVDEDYVSYSPRNKFSGVFTSGSIHYQDNSRYSLSEMIGGIQSYVADGGVLFMEYIHRSKENSDPLRHFLTGKEVASFFPNTEWVVTSNKKKRYTENPNPRNPRVHDIIWGRLYAQKLK